MSRYLPFVGKRHEVCDKVKLNLPLTFYNTKTIVMQAKLLLFSFVILSLFITSCNNSMYQVLETTAPKGKQENEGVVFESPDLKITYNLWVNSGRVEFFIYNKLNAPIYVNWDKSHLIYNGISNEYLLDGEQSSATFNSIATGTSRGSSNSFVNLLSGIGYGSSNSAGSYVGRKAVTVASSTYKPKKIIQIPPKSAIVVSNFSISKSPYFDCDVNLKNTSLNKASTKTFNEETSPISIRNYLTYSTDQLLEKDIIIENNFYVSKVTFMSESMFRGKLEKNKGCDINGRTGTISEYAYPYKKSNAFYIQFAKQL
jgi:hypothetical protein